MNPYIRMSDRGVSRRGSWCVGDLMRPGLVVVRREDSLISATGLLRARHASYAVVVAGRSIEGVLAEHDVEGLTWMVGGPRHGGRNWMNELAVEDLMRTPAVIVPADATLGQASRVLRESRRGCLVVVCEGRPQAVVTEGDIIRFLAQSEGVIGRGAPAAAVAGG
jgi:CBS domain-containing protein